MKQPGVHYRPFVRINGKTYPLKNPYVARVSIKGVQHHVGVFGTEESANAAVMQFKERKIVT